MNSSSISLSELTTLSSGGPPEVAALAKADLAKAPAVADLPEAPKGSSGQNVMAAIIAAIVVVAFILIVCSCLSSTDDDTSGCDDSESCDPVLVVGTAEQPEQPEQPELGYASARSIGFPMA